MNAPNGSPEGGSGTRSAAWSAAGERRFACGGGFVACDPATGTPVRVTHPAQPGLNFLLDDAVGDWHNASFAWGKGFVITRAGAARWDQPAELEFGADGLRCRYDLLPGLELEVERRFGATWRERYRLRNSGAHAVEVGSLALSTPFRDLYGGAQAALAGACCAHLYTGGSASYAWVLPLHGRGPGLGLRLTAGELWSYSVESRNAYTGETRGHLYLHVTDYARAPHAMGGQPRLTLPPGETLELAWELGWFADFGAFESVLAPPARLPRLAAELGEALALEPAVSGLEVSGGPNVRVEHRGGRIFVTGRAHGVEHLELAWPGGCARVGVLFHRALRDLSERRVRFVLRHQRAVERDEGRRGAFLPFDRRSGLRLNKDNWLDWSDGRERLGMPILLQELRGRGWGDPDELDAALRDFERFAHTHLVDADGTVFEDSFRREPRRLYNFAWLADFYLGQHALYGREADLLLADRVMARYDALGGEHFLGIGVAEVCETLLERLPRAGHADRAEALKARLLASADHFVGLGTDLPPHEVSYEQSVVAPLVTLLSAAYRLRPGADLERALFRAVGWLLSFAGPQPHVRLRHIPVRHWDGYWFGGLRGWGDVFPHHWSALSAVALARFPAALGPPPEWSEVVRAVLAANLVSFHDDGGATCAFIYPSCVDGTPAHHEDPVANDQDWALVYALRYGEGLT